MASASEAQQQDASSELLYQRKSRYGPNTSLSYDKPLCVVRGKGTYLYDNSGLQYLDCVNNVSHVGHANAQVAAAISSQLCAVNTNSRYLHPEHVTYTRELLATLPSRLEVLYLVCSGSEANDLALRVALATGSLAQAETCTSSPTAQPPSIAHTSHDTHGPKARASSIIESVAGTAPLAHTAHMAHAASTSSHRSSALHSLPRTHVVVLGAAYHGHTASVLQLSPYKFWGKGGAGRAQHVHVMPCPDPYRGEFCDGRAAARAAICQAHAAGGRVAMFIAESVPSCGGQIFFPPGYLQGVYAEMRGEGALVVADEVQCGFGRVGQAMWAFQTQGVEPDMVSMGKPMGNGYPMAALALTRKAAQAFAAGGMEYFNTYGGSTAAVAAGRAVLHVLREQRLQQHALQMGQQLLSGLRQLQAAWPGVIGDVRGLGLMVGLDIITDLRTKQQAPVMAKWLKERMKARRVLLSCDGPYDSVIKLKPPMCFGSAEVDMLMAHLRGVLSEELTPDVQAQIKKLEVEHWQHVCAPIFERYRRSAWELGLLPSNQQEGIESRAPLATTSAVLEPSTTIPSSAAGGGGCAGAGIGIARPWGSAVAAANAASPAAAKRGMHVPVIGQSLQACCGSEPSMHGAASITAAEGASSGRGALEVVESCRLASKL